MYIAIYNKIADKIRNIPLIKKYPTIKEIMKYALVGHASNLIDFSLYIYLTRVFSFWLEHYLIANLLAMFIASIFRFTFHKNWTFRDSNEKVYAQYLKFALILFFGLIINGVILFIAVENFNLNDIIGKLIGLAIGSLIIYCLTRALVFGKPLLPFYKKEI